MTDAATTTQVKLGSCEFDMSLNVGRKIYGKSHGCDLGDLEGGPITTMFTDPEELAVATWAVFQDRIQDAGIATEEAFFDLLDGAAIDVVAAAFKKALIDFFPWGKVVVEEINRSLSNLAENARKNAEASGQ